MITTVYVIILEEEGDQSVEGIYSTQEAAEEYLSRFKGSDLEEYLFCYEWDLDTNRTRIAI